MTVKLPRVALEPLMPLLQVSLVLTEIVDDAEANSEQLATDLGDPEALTLTALADTVPELGAPGDAGDTPEPVQDARDRSIVTISFFGPGGTASPVGVKAGLKLAVPNTAQLSVPDSVVDLAHAVPPNKATLDSGSATAAKISNGFLKCIYPSVYCAQTANVGEWVTRMARRHLSLPSYRECDKCVVLVSPPILGNS